MQPIRRDLVIPQGTTWTRAWQLQVNGQPFFDSTWTARAQVRPTKGSAQLLYEWSTAAGTVVLDDQGRVTLQVTAATSSAWPWDFGVYDVEISKGATTHRVLEGAVTVDREVTR